MPHPTEYTKPRRMSFDDISFCDSELQVRYGDMWWNIMSWTQDSDGTSYSSHATLELRPAERPDEEVFDAELTLTLEIRRGAQTLWVRTPVPPKLPWEKHGELHVGDLFYSEGDDHVFVLATLPEDPFTLGSSQGGPYLIRADRKDSSFAQWSYYEKKYGPLARGRDPLVARGIYHTQQYVKGEW